VNAVNEFGYICGIDRSYHGVGDVTIDMGYVERDDVVVVCVDVGASAGGVGSVCVVDITFDNINDTTTTTLPTTTTPVSTIPPCMDAVMPKIPSA